MPLTPLASSAQKASIEKDANKNLIEAFDPASRDQETDSIIFLDAQKDLELRKDIQEVLETEFANNKNIKKFQKKYGEEFIRNQLTSFVSIITRNPDQYWTFDENEEYQPDELKIKKLIWNTFPNEQETIFNLLYWWITGVITSIGVISIIDSKKKRRIQEIKKNRTNIID